MGSVLVEQYGAHRGNVIFDRGEEDRMLSQQLKLLLLRDRGIATGDEHKGKRTTNASKQQIAYDAEKVRCPWAK